MSASQRVSTQTHLQTFTDNWLLNRFIEKRQNEHDSAYRVAALLRHSMLPFYSRHFNHNINHSGLINFPITTLSNLPRSPPSSFMERSTPQTHVRVKANQPPSCLQGCNKRKTKHIESCSSFTAANSADDCDRTLET